MAQTKWVSAWTTAADDHRLTLATLPSQRMRGSLYLASVQTTFFLQGERSGREVHLEVSQPDGLPVGELTLLADSTAADWERLSAKLDLGAGPRTLRLALAERVPLGCRQADGRYDLVMPFADVTAALPSTPEPTTEMDLPQLGWLVWQSMHDQDPAIAQGWFEPLRLDDDLLSGWLHVQTSTSFASYPLNFNRRTNYLIGEALFRAGPRRARQQELSRSFRTTVASHPLRDDKSFRQWLERQTFHDVVVLHEGLSYATDRHPVYGRLVWIEPWSSLSPEAAAATSFLQSANILSSSTNPAENSRH